LWKLIIVIIIGFIVEWGNDGEYGVGTGNNRYEYPSGISPASNWSSCAWLL
jgi:hypothetical protein